MSGMQDTVQSFLCQSSMEVSLLTERNHEWEKMLVVVLDIIQVMLHDGGNKSCAIKKRKCCHYCGISRCVYKLKNIWAFKFSVGFVSRRTFLNHVLTKIIKVQLLCSLQSMKSYVCW